MLQKGAVSLKRMVFAAFAVMISFIISLKLKKVIFQKDNN